MKDMSRPHAGSTDHLDVVERAGRRSDGERAAAIAGAQAEAAMLHVATAMRQATMALTAAGGSPQAGYARTEQAMAMADRALARVEPATMGTGDHNAPGAGNTAHHESASDVGVEAGIRRGRSRRGRHRRRSTVSTYRGE